jgi:hypothetical protein
MSSRDTFECPHCLQETPMDEACWSELEQVNLCFDCYCEVEEN